MRKIILNTNRKLYRDDIADKDMAKYIKLAKDNNCESKILYTGTKKECVQISGLDEDLANITISEFGQGLDGEIYDINDIVSEFKELAKTCSRFKDNESKVLDIIKKYDIETEEIDTVVNFHLHPLSMIFNGQSINLNVGVMNALPNIVKGYANA